MVLPLVREVNLGSLSGRRFGHRLRPGFPALASLDGGGDEGCEERVSFGGFALELGVELNGQIPGMGWQFDDFDELVIGAGSGEREAVRLVLLPVLIVEFVSMSMAFGDRGGAVGCFRQGTWREVGRMRSEAHGSSQFGDFLLFIEQADDGMLGIFIEFGRVSVRQSHDISPELDDGALHPQADSKEGDFAFTGVSNRLNFPFDPSFAKATWDKDTVIACQQLFGTFFFDVAALDPTYANLRFVVDARVIESLVDRLVGVPMFRVLPDHSDADFMFGVAQGMQEFLPSV